MIVAVSVVRDGGTTLASTSWVPRLMQRHSGRSIASARLRLIDPLLSRVLPDQLVDLLLHRLEIEGSRVLHRRIVDRGGRQLPNELLDLDEAPELAAKELVHVAAAHVV